MSLRSRPVANCSNGGYRHMLSPRTLLINHTWLKPHACSPTCLSFTVFLYVCIWCTCSIVCSADILIHVQCPLLCFKPPEVLSHLKHWLLFDSHLVCKSPRFPLSSNASLPVLAVLIAWGLCFLHIWQVLFDKDTSHWFLFFCTALASTFALNLTALRHRLSCTCAYVNLACHPHDK